MARVETATQVPAGATPQNRPDLFGTRGQLRDGGNGLVTSAMQADKPEYATPDVSDVDAGFYVRDRGLPWHVTLSRQLGTAELMAEADGLLTTEDAIRIGGFDWNVDLLPVTVGGTDVIVPNRFVSVRSDTGQPLGIVGPGYRVVQNRDAFAFADNLVDSGAAKWETAGIMRGGTWTFISMELDHLEIQVPGDPSALKTYLLVINSFDGSRMVEGHITRVRTVCKNTAKLATSGALTTVRFRHTGSLEGKIANARETLGIAFKNQEVVVGITQQLAKTRLLDRQVQEIFESAVWPMDDGITEAAREKHHATQAYELYQTSPNLEGIRGNAWGAFNAVTEYLDHSVTYRARTVGTSEDTRADSILFGRTANRKDLAMKALLAAGR